MQYTSATNHIRHVGTEIYKKTIDQKGSDKKGHPNPKEELNSALEAQVTKNGNSASYFVSGSPGMIKAVRTSLKNKGIRHIVNDTFTGY